MSYDLEASKLGVDAEWLAARSAQVGLGRCPACFPDHDIIREGNYIQPCSDHDGSNRIPGPDDPRVTAPVVEIVVSGGAL